MSDFTFIKARRVARQVRRGDQLVLSGEPNEGHVSMVIASEPVTETEFKEVWDREGYCRGWKLVAGSRTYLVDLDDVVEVVVRSEPK